MATSRIHSSFATRPRRPGAVLALGALALAGALTVPARAQLVLPVSTPFDEIGFIQEATVDNPNDVFSGGTITVNDIKMRVPRNTLLQFPATALTWEETFKFAPAPYTGLQTGMALHDTPKPATTYEVHVQGNIVNGTHIAGLLFLSQQSVHAGQGWITAIDYATGEMRVGGVPGNPALDTRVRINDPIGRFGKALSPDPDARFTIDEDNPTIHATTFYPMCVPRVAPPSNDPLCPQKNRPKDATGTFQAVYTMPPPGGAATDPDPFLMAPFEVGDYITYNGIQISDATGRLILAHSINAALTIMTAPDTQPAYVGINILFQGISTKAGALPGTEGVVRTRVEGFSTDVSTANVVQIMAIDVDPCSGAESERTWGFAGVDTLVALGRYRFRPSSKDETFLPGARNVRVRAAPGTVATKTPNGLLAGEYTAPDFGFLFLEAAPAGGIAPPPYNFEDLQFLAQGSGPYTGGGPNPGTKSLGDLGQLSPFPNAATPASSCGGTGTTPPPPLTGTPPTAGSVTLALTGPSITFSGATLLATSTGTGAVTLVGVSAFSAAGGTITGSDPFTYTPPPAGIVGTDSFTFEVTDASGLTALGTANVLSTADTIPPTVAITSPTGGVVSASVLVSASASDNVGVASVRFFDGATQIGLAILAAPYQVTWNTSTVPNGNHNLTAVARDAAGNVATSAIVGVNVSNAAKPPVANADTATTIAGSPVTIPVLANDTDPNGFALTVTGVSNLVGGTAVINGGTTVTFTPTAGFTGTASFTYAIGNGNGGTASAGATITVTAAPNPVANPDTATTTAGTAATIAVLANDTDPSGFALTVTAVSNLVGGTAVINGGTTVTFTPTAGFTGNASFTYTISNGHLGTASASVSVTVNAAPGPTVQTTVTSDGTGPRTTPAFNTTTAGEVLVAFASSDGPAAANAQTLTISGGGLAWTRVQRAATQSGVAEIWTATAPTVLTGATVTSTQAVTAGGPFNQSLTVVAFTGASGVGASAVRGAATGAPSISLVSQAAGSLVYGVGNDFDQAIARTVPAGQTKVHEFLAPSGDTFWVQGVNARTSAAGVTVTVSDTAPTVDQWNLAIVEVKP